jgi:hypothetical protein
MISSAGMENTQNNTSDAERRQSEREEAKKYEILLEGDGWKAFSRRVKECADYYEQIAYNSSLKASERINALERTAALRDVLSFPENFLKRCCRTG